MAMSDKQCLSLLELFDLRAGEGDPGGRRHLACCSRCQALLAGLPELRLADVAPRRPQLPPRPLLLRPERPCTGQLWRALPLGRPDWAEVIAIVGRPPDRADAYLVVPVSGTPELATDRDLVLGSEPLGYPAFLDLANPGTVVGDQLVEYLGSLAREQEEALVALYRAAIGVGDRPAGLQTGAPVLSGDDPRLRAARQRGERLRALWRVFDRQEGAWNRFAQLNRDRPLKPLEAGGGIPEALKPVPCGRRSARPPSERTLNGGSPAA
jgi:hypothetical protein